MTFSVGASGSAPFRFQWFFNNTIISNATNSILSNVTTANAGNYFAIVANDFGAATSAVAKLTVFVQSSCAFSLSKTSASFSAATGSGSVTVTTSSNCSWSANSRVAWIQVTSGANKTGSGSVNYIVSTNSSPATRTGTLLIAGKNFTVTQAGSGTTGGITKAPSDFNGDGKTDFFWQNIFDGRLALWLMDGVNISSAQLLRGGQAVNTKWQIVGTQDFNGDGSVDILWQHSDGTLVVWLMSGVNFVRAEFISHAPAPDSAWRIAGVADFNRDGKADFLFRHRDGYLKIWFMNGTEFLSQSLIFNGDPVPTNWRIAGVVDFSGDTQADILWVDENNSVVLWKMSGTIPVTGNLLTNLPRPDSAWKLSGVGDLNQDKRADLIWKKADGRVATWLMNGTNRIGTASINGGRPVAGGWKLVSPK